MSGVTGVGIKCAKILRDATILTDELYAILEAVEFINSYKSNRIFFCNNCSLSSLQAFERPYSNHPLGSKI